MENNSKIITKAGILYHEPLRIYKKEINILEEKLKVKLADDFKKINAQVGYENSSFFEFASFPDGVIEYTEDFRKHGLLHRYVILSDNGDIGYILMETQDLAYKPSPIIWADHADIYNICNKGTIEYEPTIWPSFTDFFEYLVEQEEKNYIQMVD
ncbi:MAG: SMI1/KNR4 family protein [Holosporaceae bacterium]|jgi:hypothetical protein|nr:SMI1/KNR4 family protein [Holosporaceae bacterium]